MTAVHEAEETEHGQVGAREGVLRCDFCGAEAARVRRVALDRGYERLQTPHQPLYACERCSEEKELRRLGLRRA
jgi:hypothetical protein